MNQKLKKSPSEALIQYPWLKNFDSGAITTYQIANPINSPIHNLNHHNNSETPNFNEMNNSSSLKRSPNSINNMASLNINTNHNSSLSTSTGNLSNKKTSSQQNKRLSKMLRINVDNNSNNIHPNSNNSINTEIFNNNTIQTPNSIGLRRLDSMKMLFPSTTMNNSQALNSMNQDLEFLKSQEFTKIALSKVFVKDFSKKGKLMLRTPSMNILNKNETNIKYNEQKNEEKLNQICKIYKDASSIELNRIRRAQGNPHHQNNFPSSKSHLYQRYCSNSPNASMISSMPLKDNRTPSNKSNIGLISMPNSKGSIGSLNTFSSVIEAYKLNTNQSNDIISRKIKHRKQLSLGGIPISNSNNNSDNMNLLYNQIESTLSMPRKIKNQEEIINNGHNSFDYSSSVSLARNASDGANSVEGGRKIDMKRIPIERGLTKSMCNNEPNSTLCRHLVNNQSDQSKEEDLKLLIDHIIKSLLVNKDHRVEVLNQIGTIFEKIIDNHLAQSNTSPNNLILIKKVKQAYEKYFENLQTSINQTETMRLLNENNRLKEENLILLRNNFSLQNSVDEINKDNSHFHISISSSKISPLLAPTPSTTAPTTNKFGLSPIRININSQKKSKYLDLDKHTYSIIRDNNDQDNLKQIIISQQQTIHILKKKESNLMRLFYLVQKQGLDLAKLCNEEINRFNDEVDHCNVDGGHGAISSSIGASGGGGGVSAGSGTGGISTGSGIGGGGVSAGSSGDICGDGGGGSNTSNHHVPSDNHNTKIHDPKSQTFHINVLAVGEGTPQSNPYFHLHSLPHHHELPTHFTSSFNNQCLKIQPIQPKQDQEVPPPLLLKDAQGNDKEGDNKAHESQQVSEPNPESIKFPNDADTKNNKNPNVSCDTSTDHQDSHSLDYFNSVAGISPSHSELNPELKSKLRLDFGNLTSSSPVTRMNKNTNENHKPNIMMKMDNTITNNHQKEVPIGFHEEFMSKLEEFSLSWRKAALKERKL